MSRRVFVLSIDSATFDVIRPLAAAGRLPCLAGLMRDGAFGNLESTIHPITPAAWSTFITGMNPGKHGIYDFTERETGTYLFKLVGRPNRHGTALWMVASQQGLRTIVLNVPFTFPPDPVNGLMISGFDAPVKSEAVFHPRSLEKEVVAEFGRFLPDWTFPTGRRYDAPAYMVDVKEAMKYRTDLALHLMKKHPWDFFMVHYQPIDHIQHVFWNPEHMSYIHEGYEQIDRHIAEVRAALKSFGDVDFFIVSDHGAGEIRKYVFLDQWLRTHGFLQFAEGGGNGRASFLGSAARKFEKFLKRNLPYRVRGALRRAMPGLRDRISSLAMNSGVDWSRTRAYSGGMYGNLYVNLAGREPQGIVPPSEYEKTRDELAAAIGELRDPDSGEKIVDAVLRREEVYHGDHVERAPDLLIRWRDYAYYSGKRHESGRSAIFGDPRSVYFDNSEFPQTGTHRIHGIFLADGPSIRKGADLSGLRLMDMAPTILYLLGAGIPTDMDGRVLESVIDPDHLRRHPIRKVTPSGDSGDLPVVETTEEEKQAIAEKLRGLGYL